MKNVLRLVLVCSALVMFSVPSFAEGVAKTTAAASVQSGPVNINTADAKTITDAHMKGIGKKRAEAIVAYRTQHGPFKSVDDLKNIKGLSQKVIDKNRDRLSVN